MPSFSPKKTLFKIPAVYGFLLLIALWCGNLFSQDMSEAEGIFRKLIKYKVIEEIPSGDKRYTATVFTIDGGATTSVAVAINIRKYGEAFSPDMNRVFTALRYYEGISVLWSSGNDLLIKIPKRVNDEKTLRVNDGAGVKVQYETVP